MGGQRILIYRLGSLGDTIAALPVFHALRRHFQEPLDVLTNLPAHGRAAGLPGILGASGLVDEFIDYPLGTRNPAVLASLRAQLASRNYRLVIHLTPWRGQLNAWRDYAFFRCCGIPQVVGLPKPRDDRHAQSLADGSAHEWETARLARRVASLVEVDWTTDAAWDWRLSEEEIQRAHAVLAGAPDRLIMMSLGTKQPANDWGQEPWLRVIQKIRGLSGRWGLVATGAPGEATRCQELLDRWQGYTLNACGQLPPRETAAAMPRMAMFLGHDSGPMHLAASRGTPVVAVFSGSHPPGQWNPRPSSEHRLFYPPSLAQAWTEPQPDHRTIESITPEEVATAVLAHPRLES